MDRADALQQPQSGVLSFRVYHAGDTKNFLMTD